MPDDKKIKAPADAQRVNVNQSYEVEYWTKEFGVTEDELKKLVKTHGDSVAKLRFALAIVKD
jgi:hypothetical protein